jgi:hypothetical protein
MYTYIYICRERERERDRDVRISRREAARKIMVAILVFYSPPRWLEKGRDFVRRFTGSPARPSDSSGMEMKPLPCNSGM